MLCLPAEVNRQGAAPDRESWERVAIRRSADIEGVLEAVVEKLRALGYSRKEQFGVRLALEEAVVNAIKHGHGGDPSKQVSVRYRVEAERVTAEVEDEGPGFRPEQVPDPLAPENCDRDCGRGLLLMRSYMTSVRYNDRGTCVTLCKCRA
ncbi:MAG TPA: ATP-binding protein [Gemmataceae bacterium]|nr:ATP-binding protein [Gemmataceae bacterium]